MSDTTNSESPDSHPTLSDIAKELLQVDAHYLTLKAEFWKQIKERETTVRILAEVIRTQAGEVSSWYSQVYALLAELDTLTSK